MNLFKTWIMSLLCRVARILVQAVPGQVMAQSVPEVRSNYREHCASCHGQDLNGGMAQSLIDRMWLFGAEDHYVFRNIKFGIQHRGMPSYANALTDEAIDPEYERNGRVYLSCNHALALRSDDRRPVAMTRIVRGRIRGPTWTDQQVVYEADPSFYSVRQFPYRQNHLLVGALKYEEVRILHVEADRVLHQQLILRNAGRVRDVACGPDDAMYVVLNRPGTILQLTRAEQRIFMV